MPAAPPPAVGRARIAREPTRATMAASRIALRALILRDLVVLRKNFGEFVVRTLIQPFLLVFVFLYVFPSIGQGIGGGGGKPTESAFATVLVPGVVGISVSSEIHPRCTDLTCQDMCSVTTTGHVLAKVRVVENKRHF